jgi:hypothetical protein
MREAWSVGDFCCCWSRVRDEEENARDALVAIDGRRDVFCGWRCRRWRRVCWRRERTQELQIVELDMLTLFVGFYCIGVVSVALERECSSCL